MGTGGFQGNPKYPMYPMYIFKANLGSNLPCCCARTTVSYLLTCCKSVVLCPTYIVLTCNVPKGKEAVSRHITLQLVIVA